VSDCANFQLLLLLLLLLLLVVVVVVVVVVVNKLNNTTCITNWMAANRINIISISVVTVINKIIRNKNDSTFKKNKETIEIIIALFFSNGSNSSVWVRNNKEIKNK